jgi:GNAT superfamily N-acetyltransferase
MSQKPELIEVNSSNVKEIGFFCYMSKPKSEGFQRKIHWLQERFNEGMRIKMLRLPERGFIEYIPGEYAWRPVEAHGYMFIHCLWIVGRSRKKGYATLLLNECIADARKAGLQGVAMVTSQTNWLVDKKPLLKLGFEVVDQALPSFDLLALKFNDAPAPALANGWQDRMDQLGNGMTIFRSDQCPYLDNAVTAAIEAAREASLPCRVIELNSSQEVRDLAPTAYGVFSIVVNGQLLSYHSLGKEDLLQRLSKLSS